MDASRLLQLANSRKYKQTIVLVFADHRYIEVLLNWLIGLNRLGIHNYLIVSLDTEIHDFLEPRGFPTVLYPLEGPVSDLWSLRAKIFLDLCANGIDFIHSDADAIWLKNPIPRYFVESGHHIVASQGTIWPRDIVRKQGFVFCCGLLYIKSCAQTLTLLNDVAVDMASSRDDQASFNRMIFGRQLCWAGPKVPSYTLTHENQEFRCFGNVITGQSADRRLSVGLLPHHLFQRLHMPGQDAFVKHLLSDKDPNSKLKMFGRAGCNFLATDWREHAFSEKTLSRIDQRPSPANGLVEKGRGDQDSGNGSCNPSRQAFRNGARSRASDCERTYWTAQEHMRRYGPNFNDGMAEFIARVLRPSSVLEFGCGLGLYLDFLKTELGIDTVFGIEPEPVGGVFDSPNGPTQFAIDIFTDNHPAALNRKFELVMSIEVAEHIPRERHEFLFDFLVSHTSNWIVFSGARVGQGGYGHIAERDEEDWKAEFLARGMLFQHEMTRNLRLACNERNINHRRNLMVFRRAVGSGERDGHRN